ncbi:hypothetical protein Bca4012_017592 [Brassica carinata]
MTSKEAYLPLPFPNNYSLSILNPGEVHNEGESVFFTHNLNEPFSSRNLQGDQTLSEHSEHVRDGFDPCSTS